MVLKNTIIHLDSFYLSIFAKYTKK